MKKFAKRMLSCTLAVLCAVNTAPFFSASAAGAAEGITVSDNGAAGAEASEGGFTASDYAAERGTVTKHVEFKINTAEITADELEEMGYTISEDRTTASKDATLAKITYTFNKLPATLEELKEFSLASDVQGDYDYGMFAPMAATILALHAFGTNKEEAYKMLEYVYGPDQTFSSFDKQFVQTQFYTEANKVLQNCYFGGAAPENGYTPDKPFTITLEEGPYFMKATDGTPERHMSLISFAGADTERYMDVFKSSGGTWYAYESNYKHLLASVKEPTGTAPETIVLGDLDGNGEANSTDASMILVAAAASGLYGSDGLTDAQRKAADVNGDGDVNSTDASLVLVYAALSGLGQEVTFEELINGSK